ncbi:MarR family winged helix-turn-helix transcriptional regulator [Sinisalibacter aestuarii]|uniref:Transcriptional regulator n=1 Tax=Sinisalibacter aestuarii TaxID=2949426 RepID=A0ABQ5LPQ0_9RHOB|nr:MarR family transcriptional regulator [Sinisalibacter aestuarii]GKY86628.1 transcriptional regulator [Sinisalibacter aestuarii]
MKAHGMAGHLIRRLNQVSTHVFSQHMQEAGLDLTPVQFAAMDAIATHPGIDQASVAAHIAYDRATIGGVIDRLEQKGFVARNVSKRDRRAREVRLTDRGQEVLDEILPVVTALQEEILTGLDDAERQTFLRLARKAIGSLPDQTG